MVAKLINIVGSPGVGKTTVAGLLSSDLGAHLLSEDHLSNPFLSASYSECNELALASQIYFLLSRINELCTSTWPERGLFLADYGTAQDHAYAHVLLDDKSYSIYSSLFDHMSKLVCMPDVTVLLTADVDTLLQRIAIRGRDYESTFTREFLAKVSYSFEVSLEQAAKALFVVDTDELDLRQPEVRQRWLSDTDLLSYKQ